MHNATSKLSDEERWKEIIDLVDALSTTQVQWLKDHLSNLEKSPTLLDSNDLSQRAAVAFGTETGNSKAIAEKFAKYASQQNKNLKIVDLSAIKLRHLSSYNQLFLICSTHGDGEPPEPMENFYNDLLRSEKSLTGLNYAVLALGDSTYDKFCETGKRVDQQLSKLGASRLIPCLECDVDYTDQAEQWMTSALDYLESDNESSLVTDYIISKPVVNNVSKSNPLEVEVSENICLTSSKRLRSIHHLELTCDELNTLNLEPGDSIGVTPHNPPDLVSRVLSLADFTGDETINSNGETVPLVQALRESFDLTIVSAKFVKKWAELTQSNELLEISKRDNKSIREFLKSHHLSDFLKNYPSRVAPGEFVNILRPLQPRLYDVANSLKVRNDELHLTVELYRYHLSGKEHIGIASRFINNLDESETLFIYPQHNKRFRLPDNPNVPLILIAESTGVAPYRAFIQEISVNDTRNHPVWLIFREHSFKEDFLYQVDWQNFLKAGDLTKLDTIFYEDDPSVSILEKISDNYQEFKGWLQAGAHLYLSGHKHTLENVESLLASGMNSDPGISGEWQVLKSQNRIHRNLY
ncbi:diflavin oxidoreductase [Methylophaga thiooxydans]|uniref:diflavin oxidoreductase n=1 Tax=Methylophaga thiooxydans TaxID=392484 RepID=UPI0023540F49|nr:flavodoxin domain-containing protein [Methylophaga thiooxydans]